MAAQTLLLRHDYTDFDLEVIMRDTRADTGTELTSRRAAKVFLQKSKLAWTERKIGNCSIFMSRIRHPVQGSLHKW